MRQTQILITTLQPPTVRDTGVQAHVKGFTEFARENALDINIITPYDKHRILRGLLLRLGMFLDHVSTDLGMMWKRLILYVFLRYVLRRRIGKHKLNRHIVYAQDPLSAWAALSLKDEGYPLVVVLAVHFNISEADELVGKGHRTGGLLYRNLRRLELRVLPKVDRLLFPSYFSLQQVTSRLPTLAGRGSYVIPHFTRTQETAQMVPLVSGDLITIGTLEPRKNHDYILRILARTHEAGHRYRLTIVGNGLLRGQLEALALELGIADYVAFTGYVPNAASLIPNHRAYVHGSRMESFGITIIEALAVGRPVFAAPVGGIAELFRDGVEGVFWDLDDPRAAAAKLIDVLENRELYQRMSSAARARHELCFSPQAVGHQWLNAVLGSSN